MSNGDIRIDVPALTALCEDAFKAAGLPEADARVASRVLVFADCVGIGTHGVRRVVPYVARIRDGAFNPRPAITVRRDGATAIVDGDDGLGPVVGWRGLAVAIEIARETGAAFVGCRASQHFGALAPYIREATDAGMVVCLGTTALATMAPTGGVEVKVGNNPIGLGAPRPGGFPFMLDIALSIVARGKIRRAMERGERIPPDWGLDPEGRPTTDPEDALRGFVLPVGGHKGYGLALMVDILAGVLIGERPSASVRSLFQQRDQPQKVGHFFIVIDPARTIGTEAFLDGMAALEAEMRGTRPADPSTPVLLPGDLEARAHAAALRDGLALPGSLARDIRRLAAGEAVDESSSY